MSLEERVARMERQNRWFKRMGALMVLLAASFFLSGAVAQGPRRIVAEEIYLVNAAGKERAALLVTKEGSVGLFLRDAAGKFRSVYSLGNTGAAHIDFRDKNGNVRMAVGITAADSPRINIVGTNGKVTNTFR
ncbi:MAG: hypothetical protein HYZ11_01045 [Candidatus Tectomicrobia bacterium]|uniref:Uncharacterized protein n=1 Tax=Tectimicrobiota bacterium TaxID=2528274 RepID=A0A932MKK3_UNCTE|nr:hypothetical protein [Candidatus Tectomicrobia bacterium]